METLKDLLKSLESVKEDVYYTKFFNDLKNLLPSLKCTNGYAAKGLPNLEIFKNQRSIFKLVHSWKIEQWKALYEYLISEKCKPSKNFPYILDQLKHLIEEYDNITEFPSREAKAELVLDIVFEIGKKCQEFTLEEKRKVAELLVHCLQPIKTYIETISRVYRTRLDCYILQRRSALQFLVEDYNTILLEEFEKINIYESIQKLDDIIEYYRDISDSSDCESDYESAGASRMPLSHDWWSK